MSVLGAGLGLLVRLPVLALSTGPAAVARALQVVPAVVDVVEELARAAGRITALLDSIEPVAPRLTALLDGIEPVAPRLTALLSAIEPEPARLTALLSAIEPEPARLTALLDAIAPEPARLTALLTAADGLVGQVGETLGSVDGLVGEVGLTVGQAKALVTQVRGVQRTVAALVNDLAPVLSVLSRLDPELIAGLDGFLADAAHLLAGSAELSRDLAVPALLGRVDSEVLPALGSLRGLVPVVDQLGVQVDHLNDVVADVGALLGGIPGAARLLKRGTTHRPEVTR